jgi:hypothetical protein
MVFDVWGELVAELAARFFISDLKEDKYAESQHYHKNLTGITKEEILRKKLHWRSLF